MKLISLIWRIPVAGPALHRLARRVTGRPAQPAGSRFPGSSEYWESRYKDGSNSGAGSYGYMSEFKAKVLNEFVAEHGVESVIEFGCGDGNQLALARYPCYTGFDVAQTAVTWCRKRFKGDSTKEFLLLGDYTGQAADLTISLDVIYHLVEDHVFEAHLEQVFGASRRYVIVYSCDTDEQLEDACNAPHVRLRKFTPFVRDRLPDWKLLQHIPNPYPYSYDDPTAGTFSDFYIFERVPTSS